MIVYVGAWNAQHYPIALGYDACVDAVPITPLRLWNLIKNAPARAK